tara:strand:+ start:2173 stop:2667 length:495 start_codon:yes stop_codon:yes gene_type:complete
MNYFKISIGIFLSLAASRFVPHPPNFTSLIALSFYVPAILGVKYLPALVISFFITDMFIGFHNLTFFTWGSVVLIGLLSKFFVSNLLLRIGGALSGAFLFFVLTNFGVWLIGGYEHTMAGLLLCYTLAIPFFAYSIISTIIFSAAIEASIKLNFINLKSIKKNL